MRRLAWMFVLGVVACSYNRPNNGEAPLPDGEPPPLPDAGPCSGATAECFTDNGDQVLRTCDAAGEDPVVTPCPWGCLADATAHCGVFQPAGGAVTPADLEPLATLEAIVIENDDTVWNADTGEISGGFTRAAGAGVVDGIEWTDRGGVGVFRVRSLAIEGEIEPVGVRAIAIVAIETITVDDDINMVKCGGGEQPAGGFLGGGGGSTPGPGAPEAMGGGGAGTGPDDDCSGGGGGGHAGGGGQGGGGTSTTRSIGGDLRDDPDVMALTGGAGGGGGRGGNGGKGGGAIQLVANGPITFLAKGRINAGGCGGQPGQNNKAGGGGGAGGTILIEAPAITLVVSAVLAANGGSGGGGDSSAGPGQPGNASTAPALGGSATGNGGKGGNGAAGLELNGEDGTSARNGGGGGGAIGRILLRTLSGEVPGSDVATISPILGPGSPAKLAVATVQ